MNKRYQIIKPFISDKIYESSSMKKGSKKCYSEIKEANLDGVANFTIKDIDSNETFIFKIHHPYIKSKIIQKGGDKSGNNNIGSDIIQVNKLTELENNIKSLEHRILKIEEKSGFNQNNIKQMETCNMVQCQPSCQPKNNTCLIL